MLNTLLLMLHLVTSQDVDQAFFVDWADGTLKVENTSTDLNNKRKNGIYIWSDLAGNTFWKSAKDFNFEKLGNDSLNNNNSLAGGSNYAQYSQGPSVFELVSLRGFSLFTPSSIRTVYFGQKPVLRRLPDNEKYPLITLQLAKLDAQKNVNSKEELIWAEGKDSLQVGPLTPGFYRIMGEAIGTPTDFQVLPLSDSVLPRTSKIPKEFKNNYINGSKELVTVEELANIPEGQGLWTALDLCEKLLAENKNGQGILALCDTLKNNLRMRHPGFTPAEQNFSSLMQNPTKIIAMDKARYFLQIGNFLQAESLLQKLVLSDDKRTRGLAWLYMGILWTESGQVGNQLVEECLTKASIFLVGTGDEYRLASARAQLYLKKAIEGFNDALPKMASKTQSSLTNSIGAWDLAWDWLKEVDEKSVPKNSMNTGIERIQLLVAFASLVRSLNVPDESDRILQGIQQQIKQLAEPLLTSKKSFSINPIIIQLALAEIHLISGKHEEAKKHAFIAGEKSVAEAFLPGLENAFRILGQAEEASGKQQDALLQYEQSRVITRLIADRTPKNQLGRWLSGFLAQRSFVLVSMAEICIDLNDPEKALGYVEELKSEAYTRELLSTNQTPEIKKKSDLKTILESWPDNLAGLEYFLGKNRVWAFLIEKNKPVKTVLIIGADKKPLPPFRLMQQVVALQTELNHWRDKFKRQLASGKKPSGAWETSLHEIANEIVPESVMEHLRKKEYALIVPHHVLHYLPFAALVLEPHDDQIKSNDYVLKTKRFFIEEDFCFFQAPSLTIWNLLHNQTPNPQPLEGRIIGLVEVPGHPPLPNVEKDLLNFKKHFGQKTQEVLMDPGADPKRVLQLMNKSGVLLISTHGNNDPENPLESSIYLMPDDKHPDGRLTARELTRHKSRFDLVILSACYSGLGSKSPPPGDDLLGLQRVFLETGTKAVLGGLWDIDDRTAPVLVDYFLKDAVAGNPLALSWKNAQKRFLKDARLDKKQIVDFHPYFWAVSCLLGDGLTTLSP
ncbi:MAG: hypothetical protein RL553_1721 [Planctomycetota bacterium]|jgi:CHAT domain-containing protein